MNRKKFIKYISKYHFKSTNRIKGSHEIFKSLHYKFNFPVPKKKEIKKAMLWSFNSSIKKEENEKFQNKHK